MKNPWKMIWISAYIGFSSNSFAAQPFVITPNQTTVNVSNFATEPYKIIWSVVNNLNKATPVSISLQNNVNNNAISVLSSTCNSPIQPGKSCTFTIGIVGEQLLGEQISISPKVCGFQGQVCAQPIAAARLAVRKNINPIPQGNWRLLSDTPVSSFPQFVTINYPTLTVGVINQDYMPTIVSCPNLNSEYNCTVLFSGLLDYNFSTLNYLTYLPNGNLVGIFQINNDDAAKPAITYPMQYNAGKWTPFSSSFPGITYGFDNTASSEVYLSTIATIFSEEQQGYLNYGLSKAYSGSANLFSSQSSNLTKGFTNIVNDGVGHTFVSGIEASPDESVQHMSLIWLWNTANSSYTPISMPNNIPLITDMVSDGKGTIFISGLDYNNVARVWSYSYASNTFLDTGLEGTYIPTLAYSPYGYLLAGGIDNNFKGAVWYYSNKAWTNLNVPDSASIVSIAADANNDIVVTGIDSNNRADIWLYNNQ